MHTPGIGYQWAVAKQNELSSKENPTETEATTLAYLNSLIKNMAILEIEDVSDKSIQLYNDLVAMYGFLNIPFLEPINTMLVEGGIDIKYALFEDNIAYLYISDFSLTTYLNDLYFERYFSGSKHDTEVATRVKDVYNAWFGAIQRLHKQKKLKGVVIDLRSNGGGMVYDSNYVLGSLAPQGGIQYGYARFKRGAGRYDYSPLMPQSASTMADEHEIIDDVPITVLINCWSVSMSEMTSLCAKQLPNARVVGTRSWGGLCALAGQEEFTVNYAGHIGVKHQTPVYVYLPMVAIHDMNKKVLEGYGVEPDIEVSLDAKNLDKCDTQLERALDYIRTGN
jgi:C-terminal processing protease CtpA/Prc